MKYHPRQIIFYLIIVLPVKEIIGCICPPKMNLLKIQKNEMKNSDCIFIAEIIEVYDNLTYKIKVIESLDGGDTYGNIYIGQNWKTCHPYVENKGKWIMYGNMDNGFLKLNTCGISRRFDYPVVKHLAPPPKPQEKPKSDEQQKKDFNKLREKSIQIGKSQLKTEIMTLREIRDQ